MRHTTLATLFTALLGFSTLALAAEPEAAVVTLAPVSAGQHLSVINLNTADAATLQKELNGIGKSKAEAIVAYREQNGVFNSVDELLEIKGIGKALLERNRDKLTVE